MILKVRSGGFYGCIAWDRSPFSLELQLLLFCFLSSSPRRPNCPIVSCYGDGLHLKGKHQFVTSQLLFFLPKWCETVAHSLMNAKLCFNPSAVHQQGSVSCAICFFFFFFFFLLSLNLREQENNVVRYVLRARFQHCKDEYYSSGRTSKWFISSICCIWSWNVLFCLIYWQLKDIRSLKYFKIDQLLIEVCFTYSYSSVILCPLCYMCVRVCMYVCLFTHMCISSLLQKQLIFLFLWLTFAVCFHTEIRYRLS